MSLTEGQEREYKAYYIRNSIEGKTPNPTSDDVKIYLFWGPYGSGKSTMTKYLIDIGEIDIQHTVMTNIDSIDMELSDVMCKTNNEKSCLFDDCKKRFSETLNEYIPENCEYSTLYNKVENYPFNKCQDSPYRDYAADFALEINKNALQNNYNIVTETLGRVGTLDAFKKYYPKVKIENYHIYYPLVRKDKLYCRVLNRMKIEGRYVPQYAVNDWIETSPANLVDAIKKYPKMNYYIYNNDIRPPSLMWTNSKGLVQLDIVNDYPLLKQLITRTPTSYYF